MGLYSDLQSIDGEQLFAIFQFGTPETEIKPEEIETFTIRHLSQIEHIPPLLVYVRSFGRWALDQAEAGEITGRDAQMMLMGALGTAAGLAGYALQEHNEQSGQ